MAIQFGMASFIAGEKMQNKVWLITGGTGFLGQQLVKDILQKYNPKSIRVFSRNEAKQAEMARSLKDKRMRYIVGNITELEELKHHFRGVDIVIHAAAMKRIDTCESNPIQAININTFGTLNVIKASLYNNVEQLLFVSTDKAKSPETMYGATKFLSELLMRNAYHERGDRCTKFKTVRYGNVWGSTGSVATIWEESFKKDKTIVIRDKNMTRFFMGVDQASKLVLDTLKDGSENTEHSLPMKAVNMYELAIWLYPTAKFIFEPGESTEKIHEDLYEGYNSKDYTIPPWEHELWKAPIEG